MKLLLEKRADVSIQGGKQGSALNGACIYGGVEAVQLLLLESGKF